MHVFKRNQIIVTALVIMIAIAAYLNYMDRKPSEGDWVFQNNETSMVHHLVPNEEEDFFKESSVTTEINETEIDIVEGEEANKEMVQDVAPNETEIEVSSQDIKTTEPGAAIFVNSHSTSTPYFITAKIEREQSRAKQRDLLAECINNKNFPKEEKAQASQDLLVLRKRIEQESASEAMIEAKGFQEVFVRIGDETVDVVIDAPGLSEAEAAQILDIVNRQTGIALDKIYISPLKTKN